MGVNERFFNATKITLTLKLLRTFIAVSRNCKLKCHIYLVLKKSKVMNVWNSNIKNKFRSYLCIICLRLNFIRFHQEYSFDITHYSWYSGILWRCTCEGFETKKSIRTNISWDKRERSKKLIQLYNIIVNIYKYIPMTFIKKLYRIYIRFFTFQFKLLNIFERSKFNFYFCQYKRHKKRIKKITHSCFV